MTHLAVVERIDGGNQLAIAFDKVGKLVQKCASVNSRKLRPLPVKGGTGCRYGLVDIADRSSSQRDDIFFCPVVRIIVSDRIQEGCPQR